MNKSNLLTLSWSHTIEELQEGLSLNDECMADLIFLPDVTDNDDDK